jgi:hypothetical protein
MRTTTTIAPAPLLLLLLLPVRLRLRLRLWMCRPPRPHKRRRHNEVGCTLFCHRHTHTEDKKKACAHTAQGASQTGIPTSATSTRTQSLLHAYTEPERKRGSPTQTDTDMDTCTYMGLRAARQESAGADRLIKVAARRCCRHGGELGALCARVPLCAVRRHMGERGTPCTLQFDLEDEDDKGQQTIVDVPSDEKAERSPNAHQAWQTYPVRVCVRERVRQ